MNTNSDATDQTPNAWERPTLPAGFACRSTPDHRQDALPAGEGAAVNTTTKINDPTDEILANRIKQILPILDGLTCTQAGYVLDEVRWAVNSSAVFTAEHLRLRTGAERSPPSGS